MESPLHVMEMGEISGGAPEGTNAKLTQVNAAKAFGRAMLLLTRQETHKLGNVSSLMQQP